MPSSVADVVIVGGGIAGCAAAYYLAKHGVRAAIVERDGIAAHASGFAYGGLNPLAGAGIPGPNLPLALRSFQLHEELAGALASSEFNVAWRKRPSLQLAFNAVEAQAMPAEVRWTNQHRGFAATLLSGEEARRLETRLSPHVVAATLIEGTAEVDCAALARALASAAMAEMHIDEATGLAWRGQRATGVRLRDGRRIDCASVVLAQGPWSAFDWLGLTPAVAPLKGEILRLAVPGARVEQSIGYLGNYLASKPDGLLWAGTTEEQAGFDTKPSAAARHAILQRLRQVVPALADGEVVQHTACLRPMTADGLPVLGLAPDAENVYVATGGGRKGILYAPAMGSALAELIVLGRTEADIDAYTPSRFAPDADLRG